MLVYLELPLRAGRSARRSSTPTRRRWDGFRYVVLAEQFRSSLYQPFDRLPEKFGDLVRFAEEQLGPLLFLVPFGFVATLVRRLPYAILSGVSLVITCWFAASYVNAEIDRYYLVPALIAVTWIAVLAATVLDALEAFAMPRGDAPALPPATDGGVPPATAMSRPHATQPKRPQAAASGGDAAGLGALVLEIALSVSLLIPTLQALPERSRTLDHSADTGAGQLGAGRDGGRGPRRRDPQLVESTRRRYGMCSSSRGCAPTSGSSTTGHVWTSTSARSAT